jgi:hypothetical protein
MQNTLHYFLMPVVQEKQKLEVPKRTIPLKSLRKFYHA